MSTEIVKTETDSKTETVTGDVAQSEKDSTIVAKEQTAEVEIKLPTTVEDYEKALQSSSSKKMNEFLKKYGAAKLSDIEERLGKIPEYEKQITESQSLKDTVAKLQKTIDEQTPIINQKKQADFLKENNINPELAEDFMTLYEKRVKPDKSDSKEVIKQILEKHPNMGAFLINEVNTSGKNPEKRKESDGLNKIREYIGLPPKNL